MGQFVVHGGRRLSGTLRVNGAKNAALPLMAAAILAEGVVELDNVPDLRDVDVMAEVLIALGARVDRQGHAMRIDTTALHDYVVPERLMQQMRASMFVMGPLLARLGRAEVVQPGGCAIGARPINLHLEGFRRLGATVEEDGLTTRVRARRLIGQSIHLSYPSVGATENLMMAATRARGETHIFNAAREPEIVDLAQFLSKMGAVVRGAGTSTIRVVGGGEPPAPVSHTVIPDRIEAGTLLLAAAATGGRIRLENAIAAHLPGLLEMLASVGVRVEVEGQEVIVAEAPPGGFREERPTEVQTGPYPGFATDLQPQWTAFVTQVPGMHMIRERVFDNRMGHCLELQRLGARIGVDRQVATVYGGQALRGASMRAADLRAGAALVIGALAAAGTSQIEDVELIERGYENLDGRLRQLGADIGRVPAAVEA